MRLTTCTKNRRWTVKAYVLQWAPYKVKLRCLVMSTFSGRCMRPRIFFTAVMTLSVRKGRGKFLWATDLIYDDRRKQISNNRPNVIAKSRQGWWFDIACRETSARCQLIWLSWSRGKPIFCVTGLPRRISRDCARGSVICSCSTYELRRTILKLFAYSRLLINCGQSCNIDDMAQPRFVKRRTVNPLKCSGVR